MKWIISILSMVACTLLFAAGRKDEVKTLANTKANTMDTANAEPSLASFVSSLQKVFVSGYTLQQLDMILHENENTQFTLGRSKEGRTIPAFYIPGTSQHRALIIGGVHGSELSSIEVAYRLVNRLLQGRQPYYSVIVVPSLFPDNAVRAIGEPRLIGSTGNIGRYTYASAVDPNRQMPSPGKAFDDIDAVDHIGRKIELENQLLLQLVERFRPERIANIHAIRDQVYGGVYADPRTDSRGIALGYASDSSLAVDIAGFIYSNGGNVAGNKLSSKSTALYYKDPVPVPAGSWQPRNMAGSQLNAGRGNGVSLGTWASTAVRDDQHPSKNRNAMRILTIEYPGYKRPRDYPKESQQLFHFRQVEVYAAAIETYFLGRYYVENEAADIARQ